MLFNSLEFILFFPTVVFLYFAIPFRFRWGVLLLASYFFYMCWRPDYIFLIIACTLINYVTAIRMERLQEKSKRIKYLLLSLFSSLGLLFAFKYFNFFNDSFRLVLRNLGFHYDIPALNVLLPVGISFYTFQTLSYTIDVYRGKRKVEKHLGFFALYVSFFPQLVAGPIERSTRLLPQFFKKHSFNSKRVADGLKLMMWGFFKKVVIADRVAIAVNTIYNDPTNYQGYPLIFATILFAVQIYCDFSGYSDIAIGAGQVMGFKLMTNFDRPYLSKSIREFWRRWHISLSTWFRDYLYIPLGGNRVVKWRWYFNLYVTFLVCGLWHGANWTFVVWGALHGFYLIFSHSTRAAREQLRNTVGLTRRPWLLKCCQGCCVFLLVNFAWIFFRSNSLSDALYIVSHLFIGADGAVYPFWNSDVLRADVLQLGLSRTDRIITFWAIVVMVGLELIERWGSALEMLSRKPIWIRWPVYYAATAAVVFLGAHNSSQEFIYFQF